MLKWVQDVASDLVADYNEVASEGNAVLNALYRDEEKDLE